MEKSSQQGYLLGFRGMCRFILPDFDHHRSDDIDTPPEFKIEPLFTREEHESFPMDMGLFSSGHNVYMVGGADQFPQVSPTHNLYVFDPTAHNRFPVKDLSSLEKPMEFLLRPLVNPIVIQPNHHHLTYFLTRYWSPWNANYNYRRISFQSFDPIENTFRTLPSPPYTHDTTQVHLNFREVGCFVAGDYIYLFIQDHLPSRASYHSTCKFTRAFSFNLMFSEWKEIQETMPAFVKERIPIPFFHRGHAGLSQEFPDKTRIMVATCDSTPIAYCVSVGANGSLKPKSHRFLLKSTRLIQKKGATSYLHDLGNGRFLVFFQSYSIPLMLYVFQIDYEREFQIQNSAFSNKNTAFLIQNCPGFQESTKLLCSTKFLHDIPSFGPPLFYASCLTSVPAYQSSCLASASASQSSGKRSAAAEVQDKKGKMDKGDDIYFQKRRKNRSWGLRMTKEELSAVPFMPFLLEDIDFCWRP